MAKSVYEPKKIVKYNNTITPSGNIPGTAPSTSKFSTSIPIPPAGNVDPVSGKPIPDGGPIGQPVPPPSTPTSPVQPSNPTPPIPQIGPGFGFEFDGNTSLTGSYTNRLLGGESRVNFFIEPKWGPDDTGSFTVFHIGPDSADISSSLEVSILRRAEVNGYIASDLKITADSGGETKSIRLIIDSSPGTYPGNKLNGFHSASLDGSSKNSFHLSVGFFKLDCGGCFPSVSRNVSIDGVSRPPVGTTSAKGSYTVKPPYLSTPPAGYKISIGRKIQDEGQYLPARLDELVFTSRTDISKQLYNNGKRVEYSTISLPSDSIVFEIFTFDKTLSGSLGTSLEVVGTETYYTGSFL